MILCLVIAFTDVIIIVILITTVVRIQDLTIRMMLMDEYVEASSFVASYCRCSHRCTVLCPQVLGVWEFECLLAKYFSSSVFHD